MFNASVCGYISKFTSVAILFINDKDGLSIFVLKASFVTDRVICPALCCFLPDFLFVTNVQYLFLYDYNCFMNVVRFDKN